MKTIVYLHGACSTSLAFQHIKEKLPEHRQILIEYDYGAKLTDALTEIVTKILLALDQPYDEFDIVSHSLGGIMAVNVAALDTFNIGKVVSISTPYGGSETAAYLKFVYPFTQLFKEISPNSAFLLNTRKIMRTDAVMQKLIINGNFLPIATTIGQGPLHKRENDNVVTLRSQTCVEGIQYHTVPYNHFEVLQAPAVINKLTSYLFG